MWNFYWNFHMGFCWVGFNFYWFWFRFGMSFSSGLGWLWVGFFGGFSLIFFFFFLAWFELGFLMVCLTWCWFWVNFVVDYQLLKWVAVVMVGWCWVGGLMFVIFLFLLGCYGCWEREGCWVAVAVRKERENLKGEREKIRNYWCT